MPDEPTEEIWFDPIHVEQSAPLIDDPAETSDPVEEVPAVEAEPVVEPVVEPPEPVAETAEEAKPPNRRARRAADPEVQARAMRALEAEQARQAGELVKLQPVEADPLLVTPNIDDYHDPEEWAKAYAAHTEQAVTRRFEQAEQARAQQAEHIRQRTVIEAFREREEGARDRRGDYDAVVYAEGVNISPELAEQIAISDVGPEIAYRVAQDADLMARLAEMPEVAVAREIGKLEATIAAEATPAPANSGPTDKDDPGADSVAVVAEPAPARRPVTNAPPPITPVGGGSAPARNPENMDYDEFKQWRANGGGR